MGIPKFFSWLTRRYHRVTVLAVCEPGLLFGEAMAGDASSAAAAEEPFVDTSGPNPTGIEFDNLYLDMNGIIHPCCHPESGAAPKSEEEMLENIFRYVDHVFSLVRPRKLVFFAVDGVAPRAKMNQQRSRRFQTAQATQAAQAAEETLREELLREGRPAPPMPPPPWDSNVITPGTTFQDRIAEGLRWYARDRLARDPGWHGLEVVLSSAAVPGEGEHKIIDFIRRQRNASGYNPNTRHCCYGGDADLIVLSLATHEPNFAILREVFTKGMSERGLLRFSATAGGRKPFCFFRSDILREYLEHIFGSLKTTLRSFAFDLENVIDDFVFICFFIGNDFMPRLPTLDISQGAIDALSELYKMILPSLGGYLTRDGVVVVGRVVRFLAELAKLERNALSDSDQQQQQQQKQDAVEATDGGDAHVVQSMVSDGALATTQAYRASARVLRKTLGAGNHPFSEATELTKAATQAATGDLVVGELGWRERYYAVKFGKDVTTPEGKAFLQDLCQHYMEGLIWVMRYYYQGCCSWTWFYPYHYGPFACDLATFIDGIKFSAKFSLGEPFRPFEQLLAVLPTASARCVPEALRCLMTSTDSPIADFYPSEFSIDLNGKKEAWEGVALLPFIDEQRLLSAIAEHESGLDEEERQRNERNGAQLLFVAADHPLAKDIEDLDEDRPEVQLKAKSSRGLLGEVALAPRRFSETSEFPDVRVAAFRNPAYPSGYIFRAKLLKGASAPKQLTQKDLWVLVAVQSDQQQQQPQQQTQQPQPPLAPSKPKLEITRKAKLFSAILNPTDAKELARKHALRAAIASKNARSEAVSKLRGLDFDDDSGLTMAIDGDDEEPRATSIELPDSDALQAALSLAATAKTGQSRFPRFAMH